MAIQQHSEAVGTPTRVSVNRSVVTIRSSDALPKERPPRPKTDPTLPEGSINVIHDADEHAIKRWKFAIATYLVHEMDLLPKVIPGTQFTLDEFPKNYKLYVHLKGDKDHPRKDYYLIGSQWVRKFRSPEEFVFHAKWLAFNGPLDVRGRPACACKYCGGSDQTEIGNYLNKKVGYSASHHGPFKPTRRRNSVEEKPILFKDYTRLRETAQDIKPGLHVIKDEEF